MGWRQSQLPRLSSLGLLTACSVTGEPWPVTVRQAFVLSRTPYHTIPYHNIPYRRVPYRTIPYHNIPYRTIPYRTVPYLLITRLTARPKYAPKAWMKIDPPGQNNMQDRRLRRGLALPTAPARSRSRRRVEEQGEEEGQEEGGGGRERSRGKEEEEEGGA